MFKDIYKSGNSLILLLILNPLIILLAVCLLCLTGCGKQEMTVTEEVVETIGEVDYSQIDIYTLIPAPEKHFLSGDMSETRDKARSYYRLNIDGCTSVENTESYIDACLEAGFTDVSRYYEYEGGIIFRAKTPDGFYEVSVNLSLGSNEGVLVIFQEK